MVQAMLGGDLPFAAAAGNAAVDANLAGADVIMVGALAKVPAFYIMALPEIKSIEDLRGKAVGVTRFGSSTDFTMRYLLRKVQKFARSNDPKIVNAVDQYAIDYVEKIPYNTREGVQEVLNQAIPRNPKAKDAKPESFYDDRFVKELEAQGLYKQLWK
jgi:hypothetical protein